MKFEGILRDVVAPGPHLLDLGDPRSGDRHPRAHPETLQAHTEVGCRERRVVAVVAQRVVVVVGYQDVDVAVAVRVEAGDTAPLPAVGQPGCLGLVDEPPFSVRSEQANAVVHVVVVLLVVLLAPAVDVEDVLVAVVVEVGETGCPAPAAVGDAGIVGDVGEGAGAVVGVETVAVADQLVGAGAGPVDRGHEPVEVAVVVVVDDRSAHSGLILDDFAVRRQREAAVAVVAEHLAGAEVGRHQEIEVAV